MRRERVDFYEKRVDQIYRQAFKIERQIIRANSQSFADVQAKWKLYETMPAYDDEDSAAFARSIACDAMRMLAASHAA